MSVRHASVAGKIALPPRSPLPLPSAVKVTEDPVIEAVTEVSMNVPLSVQRALAWPLPSVLLALALTVPLPGAVVHVTVAPLTGAPAELVTVTTSGAASTDDIVPCCASPLLFAITVARGPVLPLVSGPGVVGVAAAHARPVMISRRSRMSLGKCMSGRRCVRARREQRASRQSIPPTTMRSISWQPPSRR